MKRILFSLLIATMPVGAVDALDARRTIAERRIDAGLPQVGRFEDVGVGRQNQGRHRQLLSLDRAASFGTEPIAVKTGMGPIPRARYRRCRKNAQIARQEVTS